MNKIFAKKPPRDGGNLINNINLTMALPQPDIDIHKLMKSRGVVVYLGYTNSDVRQRSNSNGELVAAITAGTDVNGMGVFLLIEDERTKAWSWTALTRKQVLQLCIYLFAFCLVLLKFAFCLVLLCSQSCSIG